MPAKKVIKKPACIVRSKPACSKARSTSSVEIAPKAIVAEFEAESIMNSPNKETGGCTFKDRSGGARKLKRESSLGGTMFEYMCVDEQCKSVSIRAPPANHEPRLILNRRRNRVHQCASVNICV